MPQIDWVLKQRVEADICLIYHQLAEYSYLMPDLYYGDVFLLGYWEFLDFKDIDDEDRIFIRDGCLLMILGMCLEYLGQSNIYIEDKLEICARRLSCVVPNDEKTAKLLTIVQLAVQLAQNGKPEIHELNESLIWVYREYVQGYFRKIVHNFDNNPYYKN